MALGTEEATFNAAVDTLMAAWNVLIDVNSANERMQICWVKSQKGDNANNSKWGADTTATFNSLGPKDYFIINPDVTDDVPLEVGGKPLFWKVTNDAGDLS